MGGVAGPFDMIKDISGGISCKPVEQIKILLPFPFSLIFYTLNCREVRVEEPQGTPQPILYGASRHQS